MCIKKKQQTLDKAEIMHNFTTHLPFKYHTLLQEQAVNMLTATSTGLNDMHTKKHGNFYNSNRFSNQVTRSPRRKKREREREEEEDMKFLIFILIY